MKRYEYLSRFDGLLSDYTSDIIFIYLASLMLKPAIGHDPESVTFMSRHRSLFPLDSTL
jgi:hypothetical protein